MQRRSFLSMLGLAAVAAPFARFLPAAEPIAAPVATDIIIPAMTVPSYAMGMRGIPYIVDNSGRYFGFYQPSFQPSEQERAIQVNLEAAGFYKEIECDIVVPGRFVED